MKLFNLINIADPKVTMILTGIRPDGSKIGYNFKNNTWMNNNILMNPDRLSNIWIFSESEFYKSIKRFDIVDFSNFNTSNIKAFKGIEIYKNRVVEITINIGLSKKELIRESFRAEARKEKKANSSK